MDVIGVALYLSVSLFSGGLIGVDLVRLNPLLHLLPVYLLSFHTSQAFYQQYSPIVLVYWNVDVVNKALLQLFEVMVEKCNTDFSVILQNKLQTMSYLV